MIKNCSKHGMVHHIDAIISKGKRGYKCSQCSYEAVKRRRKKLKEMAVAYKGGECTHCGYTACLEALEFHHLDPTQKDFGFGCMNVLGWERIKVELDKCILLCANCHREEHVRLKLLA